MLTPEQLEARKKGIGGSDAGTIMGINPYKSRFTLYQEKLGLIESDVTNEAMYWGNALEDDILTRFFEETGFEQLGIQDNDEYKNKISLPEYIIGNPDTYAKSWGGVHNGRNQYLPSIVDAKSICWPAYENKEEFLQIIKNGEHPYYYQIMHYIILTGYEQGYLAIFFMDKREFEIIEIKRSEEIIEKMLQEYKTFWKRVSKQEWPEIMDGSNSTATTLKNMYPHDNGISVNLGPEHQNSMKYIEQNKRMIKDLEENKRKNENIIRNAINEATFGIFPDGTKVSLKTTNKKGYQPKYIEPTSYRTLRKVKEK